ncbi:uncharacterized protein LOC110842357 [Folsomia candida]|uniref:uncharacterized protein LOC110842357 n=1 Tax=Folsomia candida TaxID=158441 RepID=UPI0016052C35|nr:uncharacterized protein LOC110842357 [Folsomia candida]
MCSHKQSKEEEAVTDGVKTMTNIQPTVAMKTSTNEDKVVLRGTMRVKVSGNKNQYREARLLIDSGSDISYIREEFAEELHLTPIGKKVFTTEVFGGGYDVCERKQYNVKLEGLPAGKNMLKKTEEVPLFSARTICGDCAPIPVGPWIKDLLKLNVVLTDTYVDSHNIDILIGSNLIGRLVTGKMVKLNTSVIATETTIGWYLNEELPKQESQTLAARSIVMCTRTKELSALWDLDTLGISDTIQKATQDEHEAKVKEEFQKNLERDRDGRYVVKLPWLTESMRIPDNRNVAMKRLESTSTRVVTKGEFENYDNIFRAWEKEGIIERLDREEKPTGHYLPHRPVFKPESLTTPVRPVFDASCRVGNYPSLNQCLEKGPNLLEIIPKILIRFRAKKVGVISDIRKAFQMIGVNQEDRKFQRFLWWKDFEAKVVQEYQHCRVVFGMNCSPFILAAVLEFHLLHLPEEEKKTGMELLRSLYVDNCVTSFESISQYTKFRAESTAILLHAKMDLREWESNADDKMEREVTSVLGYNWDKSKDEMFCDLPLHLGKEDLNVTKRTVLSIASQVFDPIGFTSPTVLQLKIMLQEAWAQDLKWDELWGTEAINKVKTWCEEARVLSKIRIPRWAVGSIDDLELHTFTDASQNAYSAVVFARSTRESNVCVQLLMAKSRVAPMKKEDPKKNNKKITIPRLELMGCLIGVRLANTVNNALGYEDVKSYFWSDSTTALQWIRRDEIWNTFVGNRIKEINKNSNKEDWRHCPGKQNPADLPSRGCSPTELLNSKWWDGPAWLKLSKEAWPPIKEESVVEALVQEEKKKSNLTLISRHDSPIFSTKFASYQKNLRVLAYILRFVGKGAVKKPYPKFVTLPELRFAEVILIRVLQRQYFPDAKKVQPRVILMEDNLLHVRTKLEYSDDSDGFRFPMLLPAKCQLVQELIREMHRFHGHGGVQFTVGKLREKYWIQQARKTVTQAIRGCANCRRFDAKPFQVNPVALPEKRVTVGEVFSTTGVDLAGPLYLNDGKKCWIVLYTCAVYRCVELDIVESLSTEAFLNSLERFLHAHGRPSTIYSDNGTNFVGAINLFKKLDWAKIENQCNVKMIQWILNPPTAAWWGGWWERLVRSVKDLLKRMLQKAKLTRDELATFLAVVASTINEWPLTTVNEDGDDLIPLTPAMFLKGTKMSRFPEVEFMTGRELQIRFKQIKKLQLQLQTRFRKEYLAELVQRASEKKTPDPKIGDIVLVGADNKKRWEWPLGKIVELFKGKDGECRSAIVQTSKGLLRRPVQRLYPLEVPHGDSDRTDRRPPVKEKSYQEEVDETEEDPEDNTSQDQPEVTTKFGRRVIRPVRYGKWNE